MINKFLVVLIVSVSLLACITEKNNFDEHYVNSLKQERANKDWELQYDAYSPFKVDTSANFSPLKYFEPTEEFIFKSKLIKYPVTDTITIYGTRGEARKAIKEGYLTLKYRGKDHKLNVYKSFGPQGQTYYSLWFTDETTGNETYSVGRYLEFELNPDSDFIYTIDFNKAYNPYCAYSDLFTCPIPTKEDHLNFKIMAGEKKFHN